MQARSTRAATQPAGQPSTPTTITALPPQARNDTSRANELGFRAETSFDEIVRVYVEDELSRDVSTQSRTISANTEGSSSSM